MLPTESEAERIQAVAEALAHLSTEWQLKAPERAAEVMGLSHRLLGRFEPWELDSLAEREAYWRAF